MRTIDHQGYLAMRQGAAVLEADRYGEKVLRLADGSFLKLFRRKRLLSSAAWYPYAQRFADNAAALERLGIPIPKILDVVRITSIRRDAVHYLPLSGSTLRDLSLRGLSADAEQRLKAQFNSFVEHLHETGIYFRSLHLGNVVLTPDGRMGLIDFSDLRIYQKPLGKWMRQRNLRRLQTLAADRSWLDSRWSA